MVGFVRKMIIIIIMMALSPAISAQMYGTLLCKNTNFYCHTAKRGDTWQQLFTNDTERMLVMKINRINIPIYPGMKIAIPKNHDLEVLDYSPLPTNISPPGTKTIYVSLKELAWGAYDADGHLVNWGPVSGGRGYCPDIHRGCHTLTGKFTIYQKEGRGCFSRKFPVGRGGAPMPYCMFFHGGFALHGSHEVPGYNASHGCVRMFVNDAQWLNQEFVGDKFDVAVIIQKN
jgi:hypothetical protein